MINVEQLRFEAGYHAWDEIDYQDNIKMISFRNCHHIRLNVYLTTGTMGVCEPGKEQKYVKNQPFDAIVQMMENLNQ